MSLRCSSSIASVGGCVRVIMLTQRGTSAMMADGASLSPMAKSDPHGGAGIGGSFGHVHVWQVGISARQVIVAASGGTTGLVDVSSEHPATIKMKVATRVMMTCLSIIWSSHTIG